MICPAPAALCACGRPYGRLGRIYRVTEDEIPSWRCAVCADLELIAVQWDQLQDALFHKRDLAIRRVARTGRQAA